MLTVYFFIVDFVVTTLRPPPDATTTRIRKAGALTAALGLVLLTAAVALAALVTSRFGSVRAAVWVVAPLWIAGFSGTILGAFRLVLATEPDQMSPAKRMGLGVLFGCGSLVVLLGLAVLVAVLLSSL
ncbi:MAG: hypothetical protein ABJE95_05120 [Byssovorax sp.]